MNGSTLVNALAVVCVSSLAALTFAAPPQDLEVGQSGDARPLPPVPVEAEAPALAAPIVHRGIPGELAVDGVYAEQSVTGETVLRDVSFGRTPVLPVVPRPSDGGYLAGCPCDSGTFEDEPDCGDGNGLCDTASDTTNGGCNSLPPVFSPIALGETYCGTAYWDGACRDTDWYQFTVAQPTRITWRGTAEFDFVLLLLGDGSGTCPAGVVTFALGNACEEASLSATVPAGTWWVFMGADFAGPTFACGARYSATLLESCEVYLSEAVYNATFPNQTLEDFEDSNVTAGNVIACAVDPVGNAGDGGTCFDAGDIVAGLTLGSIDASGLALLGAGVNGYANKHVGANFDVKTVISFPGGVRQCGMTLVPTPGPTTFTVDVFTPGGALLESESVAVASAGSGGTFFGIDCPGELIGRVELSAAAGFQNVDNIRFGQQGGAALTLYTSSAVFDTSYPDLAFENFEDSNVGAGGVVGVGVDPVGNAGDGGVAFDAGDIEAGLSVGTNDASGLALVGPGFGGPPSPSRQLSGNAFSTSTDLIFSPSVRQAGTMLRAFGGGTASFDVTVFGTGGEVLFNGTAAIDSTAATNRFWGIASERAITRIRFNDTAGTNAQFVDEVRFGTSKEHLGVRYCSPNLPNSTGNSGLMIVTGSNVDADDDLTLTAMQLPLNSNIGYFIMGTGTNSFIPTGAGSFICVTPGLKRYLPPVNNTNQFPGGFDRVVGTQGNGHPISANITPGSTWNFQAWHRDSNAGTSHFTDAVSVTFQ